MPELIFDHPDVELPYRVDVPDGSSTDGIVNAYRESGWMLRADPAADAATPTPAEPVNTTTEGN